MLQDAEGWNGGHYRHRQETLRDILDSHCYRNRRLRIDARDLLGATGFRSRDERVTYDVLANFGGAEVLAV
jgi:hypothetical protein